MERTCSEFGKFLETVGERLFAIGAINFFIQLFPYFTSFFEQFFCICQSLLKFLPMFMRIVHNDMIIGAENNSVIKSFWVNMSNSERTKASMPDRKVSPGKPMQLVCTSMKRNLAKSTSTLEEIGWEIHPAGNLTEWDGLLTWFMSYVPEHPELLEDVAIRRWFEACHVLEVEKYLK